MMPVVQPDEEEASGSSAAPSPSVGTPSPTKNKVKNSTSITMPCFKTGSFSNDNGDGWDDTF